MSALRALLASTLLIVSLTAARAERVALVIGNSTYKVGPLANPVNDASAVADVLKRELGFGKVILRTNVTKQQMEAALAELASAVTGADIALVYFAGHGTEREGRNYLIPIDANLAKASDLDLQSIALPVVVDQLGGAKKLKLVILDACRNNVFPLAGLKRTAQRGLGRVEPEDNTLIAYSAKDGTTADDGQSGGHSPFTSALLKHIATPGIEVDYMLRLVRDDVSAATNREQQPHTYGTLGRERIYLNARAAPPPAASTPPAPKAQQVATAAPPAAPKVAPPTAPVAPAAAVAPAPSAPVTPSSSAPPPPAPTPAARPPRIVPAPAPAVTTPRPAAFVPAKQGTVRGLPDNVPAGARLAAVYPGFDDEYLSVALSPDGAIAAAGGCTQREPAHGNCTNSTVRFWNLATAAELKRFATGVGEVTTIGFSPDGSRALFGSFAGRVAALWNVKTGRKLHTFARKGWTRGAFSPDGRLVVTHGFPGDIEIWDSETGAKLRTIASGLNGVSTAAFSPDGRMLAAQDGSKLLLFDVASGALVADVKGPPSRSVNGAPIYFYDAVTWTTDGAGLLVGSDSRLVRVDAQSRQIVWKTELAGKVKAMAASRSGRFVVASSCPTTEEQREVPQFRMRPTNSPAPAAPAPPSVYYTAVVCQGGSFAVLRVDTGEILREIAAHDGEVRSLAISADERHVITGGADKKVRLWDVADITGAR